MPIPQHVVAPPNPAERWILALANYVQDLSADRGSKLTFDDARYIAEKTLSWGDVVIVGTAPIRDVDNTADRTAGMQQAEVALHINASRRGVGLRTRPQYLVKKLPDGRFLAEASAVCLPLLPPSSTQTAAMGRHQDSEEKPPAG